MPTAILQTNTRKPGGQIRVTSVSKSITHNSRRLYHEGGRTYEYIGDNGSGERIYRDTKPR